MPGFSTIFGVVYPLVALDPASNAYPAGRHLGNPGGLTAVEADLIAANIKLGKQVFGVNGSLVSWVYDTKGEQGFCAKTVPALMSAPVPTAVEDHSGGGQTGDLTLTPPVPSLAIAAPAPTISALGGGVAHKQTGPVDTDETAATNNATANDMDLLPATGNATGDGFYFGLASLWDTLILNVGQAGAGTYTIAWKYWNGSSWAALTIKNDQTNHFKTTGIVRVAFERPGDWATTTIAAIAGLYWIKAEVTFTSMSTQPLGTQAWALNF